MPYTPPVEILPTEDIEERMLLIDNLVLLCNKVATDHPVHLNRMEFSLLALMPIVALRYLVAYPGMESRYSLCLRHAAGLHETMLAILLKMKRTVYLDEDWEEPARRDDAEAEKCKKRDSNCCLILGTNQAVRACHIFPFFSTAKEKNRIAIRHLLWSYITFIPSKEERDDLLALLASSVGCLNKTWNMLSLNRQLRRWWQKGYFGLVCLGMPRIDEDGCTVLLDIQFRWLLRSSLGAHEYIADHRTEWREMEQRFADFEKEVATKKKWALKDKGSGDGGAPYRRIRSGYTFQVRFPRVVDSSMSRQSEFNAASSQAMDDALKMKKTLDFVWPLSILAALTAAAEDANRDCFPEDPYEYASTRLHTKLDEDYEDYSEGEDSDKDSDIDSNDGEEEDGLDWFEEEGWVFIQLDDIEGAPHILPIREHRRLPSVWNYKRWT